MDEGEKEVMTEKVMEGVASIALLPNGSISGHFIQLPNSICYGLHGTELACERECSRGEDYRLIKLTVTDYNSAEDMMLRRYVKSTMLTGWQKDVVGMLEEKHPKDRVSVSFECETLKAENAAEEHIQKFMPKLVGMDAVVNIGPMCITGIDFEAEAEQE
ncbi:hypothetical protein Fot_05880 [Forsythia ovata]|uniref:Uncharacterized protein n=1 Tax=Forsythia ovata TaxID=205694 RepID=A0ABD1WRQ1_9LAMI